jgi:hypothetical protein
MVNEAYVRLIDLNQVQWQIWLLRELSAGKTDDA